MRRSHEPVRALNAAGSAVDGVASAEDRIGLRFAEDVIELDTSDRRIERHDRHAGHERADHADRGLERRLGPQRDPLTSFNLTRRRRDRSAQLAPT